MGELFEDRALRNRTCVFKDRTGAGRLLAKRISSFVTPDSLVLAIPAGGIPVALEVARELKLPLDLMIVRKIQIPGNTEAGFGAVGPDGEVVFNDDLLSRLHLTEEEIKEQVERTRKGVEARIRQFHGIRPFPAVAGRPVILVDDGLASGFTMGEAVRFLRRRQAGRVLVAVPTAPQGTIDRLLPLVDEIHCLNVRIRYPFAVAEAYEDWYDLSDPEALGLLKGVINE
jgi:putative phosphoribosyl transferase